MQTCFTHKEQTAAAACGAEAQAGRTRDSTWGQRAAAGQRRRQDGRGTADASVGGAHTRVQHMCIQLHTQTQEERV